MLVDPPIDKLVETVGNKYALVGVLSKRARTLMDKRHDYIEHENLNPISLAAKEIADGKVEAVEEA
ncbi:MAG: DNA-directed RNA polymerase subunit omega [Clostridiales bacterium]|nr:DNA-directed RNA polymerase subunit omega [Clostridiales bacterium]MCH5351699.1 DNA-directed RNA polymerase subunit omega [Clostridiales bacterium]